MLWHKVKNTPLEFQSAFVDVSCRDCYHYTAVKWFGRLILVIAEEYAESEYIGLTVYADEETFIGTDTETDMAGREMADLITSYLLTLSLFKLHGSDFPREYDEIADLLKENLTGIPICAEYYDLIASNSELMAHLLAD